MCPLKHGRQVGGTLGQNLVVGGTQTFLRTGECGYTCGQSDSKSLYRSNRLMFNSRPARIGICLTSPQMSSLALLPAASHLGKWVRRVRWASRFADAGSEPILSYFTLKQTAALFRSFAAESQSGLHNETSC